MTAHDPLDVGLRRRRALQRPQQGTAARVGVTAADTDGLGSSGAPRVGGLAEGDAW